MWKDPGTLLPTDGATPVPRLLLVDEPQTDDGYFSTLSAPRSGG
ncbi:hypothetical protein AB0D54_08960 [Streptomyces xanthophaeus]